VVLLMSLSPVSARRVLVHRVNLRRPVQVVGGPGSRPLKPFACAQGLARNLCPTWWGVLFG
jgi:hypothetical protein